MSTSIALIGAGGKMGCRLTDNFRRSPHRVAYLETSAKGLENLRARGIQAADDPACVSEADVVILAVPDVTLGEIAHDIVPRMKSGALLMTLDPAAPLDNQLPARTDIGCIVAHPCHPSVFNWEPTEAAFRDFYGGISAKQAIVCALMWGSEAHYVRGVEIATEMYAPVHRVHRVTLEQMAMLEPALVETLAQTCMEVAVLFGEVNGTFSDAAYKISRRARPLIFQDGWERVFEMTDIREQVRDITTRE
jgi:D-apionate oxidoisomerase